ncbi:nuclease-related domain-containing DEAD/DEAH box helicase [Ruminococcus flavefaciens]|uniref:nuclease-related domain-containing DEAD/DEAH box helicase n=1 Tax=Ruminococcus flavefaciens TaxID=1265 RepID=UPI0026EF4145|nr:NERD domain-containing protein/DEAD/DEAH box helicase [Ruminococcus flavefaciens]MDD7516831.1 NERD domain-containing protein/DEAD/DEAH box helicase [Ruminococcus flavefaciens]MDY5692261.1 NERD domain-containing protein/DEAD/DEAH box helicase [Ruminococcus flavefaciens]
MSAHMIPPVPKDFDIKSDEGVVFNALSKLPDDYYVFHSVVINEVVNRKMIEREIDFVVANQRKGVLCIEAKNGDNIHYTDRTWYYSSNKKMKHGGPYEQAATAKRALRSKMRYHKNPEVANISFRCKMFHAAWFFGMSQSSFEEKNRQNGLPEGVSTDITLFCEDLADPTKKIESIFSITIPHPLDEDDAIKNDITSDEFRMLLDSVFCPEFHLIPSPAAKNLMIEEHMNQLLYEQYRLLDFLEDQPTAVINGAAGTGKTMIAVEKARRNSIDDESVLFLCYNRLLCDNLNALHKNNPSKAYRNQFKNVDFMTISRLAKEKVGNFKDFDGLLEWLLDCVDSTDKFKYKHVIIDEGQDFGLIDKQDESDEATDAESNCTIIDTLQELVLEKNGTFYLFYDKYQMIQGGSKAKYKLPDCINNSDCRLTLHYNCRNTKEIAQTSVTPLKDNKNRAIKPKTACTWYEPAKPVMHLVGGEKKAVKALNNVLDKYKTAMLDNVIILTPGTIEYSCIADKVSLGSGKDNGYYLYEHNGTYYRFTTCIRYKGLEADAIVMIDLDKESFTGFKGLEFYVGSSRAKQYLDLVAIIQPNEYAQIVSELDPNAPQKKDTEKMKKILSSVFSADVETE